MERVYRRLRRFGTQTEEEMNSKEVAEVEEALKGRSILKGEKMKSMKNVRRESNVD